MERISDEQLHDLLTYWGGEPVKGLSGGGRDTMAATLLPALRELLALREESKWIAVTERLPEDREKVDLWLHVYASPMSMGMGDSWREPECWREGSAWYHRHRGENAEIRREYVTHWRPLPAPPTEDTDGG